MSELTERFRVPNPPNSRSEPGTMATVPAIRTRTEEDVDAPQNVPSKPTSGIDEPTDQILPTLVSNSAISIFPPRSDLPIVFPGYETHGELGRGGMGVVYRARQRSLNRPVALKVILAGPHASDADKARFRLEAEAGARLKHPNIVQVYDVGEHAGFAYIAFELIEGQTLRQWQGEKPVDPKQAARLIAELARGVQQAHEHGIVHRDIKPANVLMASPTGERGSTTSLEWRKPHHGAPQSASVSGTHATLPIPKLTDFGLAKSMEGGADLTITGMACGTPHYMAPEQVRGKAVGAQADVYGLGAVLYELLTGRPPFKGTDAAQVMDKILRSDPERVRRVNPDVPRDLEVIASKCLEKDASRRYESAAALVEDLERFLAGRPITARPVSLTERTWRWCRRNPVVTVFLILSTAACLATGNLALALARSVTVEREARGDAESSHRLAVAERHEAEKARDDLRIVLGQEEAARKFAQQEQEAAHAAKLEAVEARKQADLEKTATAQQRDRANGHLRLARTLIRTTFHEVNQNDQLKLPEFRELRASLLRSGVAFFKEFSPHAGNDPDALDELADCAHMMGYLEYLNGDHNAAAAHYITAADVCSRWAAVEPDDPEARLRQAWALQNAGNALYNARRLDDAEKRYREAIALYEGVVEKHPKVDGYLKRLVLSYPPLYESLRERQRWADGADVCRKYQSHAKELVRRGGPKVESILMLSRADQCLAQMLDRTGKAEDAEPFFNEAVAIRESVRAKFGWSPDLHAEAGRLYYCVAQHYFLFVKQPEKAPAAIEKSIEILEQGCKADANSLEMQLELAESLQLAGTIYRQERDAVRAEDRFDRAIIITEKVLAKNPKPSTSANARRLWVMAMTGRAHLYNATGRHRDAAAQWEKLANEDAEMAARPRHALFALQSKNFAGQWRGAFEGAEKLVEGEPPTWLLVDVAKVLCRVGRLASEDANLNEGERKTESEKAFDKALLCLEKAKKAGAFKEPGPVKYFESSTEFDPIRDKFKPRD